MVNHEQRAFVAWNILIKQAAKRSTITYKALSDQIGIHPRPIRYVLEPIQRYCLNEKLPPLTILVVSQESGQPGPGFIGWSRDNMNDGYRQTYAYPWTQEDNPFSYAEGGTTADELAKSLCTDTDKSDEIYQLVKVRGSAQDIFRRALMIAYESKCAICGVTTDQLLEAAHIIPWTHCEPSQRVDVTNGVLLCANHHRLFDSGTMTIGADYRIHVRSGVAPQSASDASIITEFDGRLLQIPRLASQRPDFRR